MNTPTCCPVCGKGPVRSIIANGGQLYVAKDEEVFDSSVLAYHCPHADAITGFACGTIFYLSKV